jgi:hypothetical protein
LIEFNVTASSLVDLAGNANSLNFTGTTLDAAETLNSWNFDGTGAGGGGSSGDSGRPAPAGMFDAELNSRMWF